MRYVFLVSAHYSYEGDNAIKAFQSESDADAFIVRLNQYQSKEPRCPPVHFSTENDALWSEYTKKHDKWKSKHPGGEETCADMFCKTKIPFI